MPKLQDPSRKYRAFAPVGLEGRRWPDAVLTRPPIWLSTDLRDGNQALIEPMDPARKLRLLQTLVRIGFKQFEGRANRQRQSGERRPEPVPPGRRSQARLLRHRRQPSLCRAWQLAAGSSASSVRREPTAAEPWRLFEAERRLGGCEWSSSVGVAIDESSDGTMALRAGVVLPAALLAA